jgi:SAM-dependent methyltransferase
MREPEVPGPEQRLKARQLYGADPVGYEAGRPEYPERVYQLLATRCGLSPGTSVLEIGPGTGRVTRRLLSLGADVVAVEPDDRLAAYLGQALASPRLQLLVGAFEDVPLQEDRFDLAVAAMSFHWVDQERGLRKVGLTLRPGGWFALWWTLFGDPSRPDPFGDAAGDLLDEPALPEPDRPPFELDVAGWELSLRRRAGLVDVGGELIRWTARFDLDQLRAFYGSTFALRRRTASEQEQSLDALAHLARTAFGGIVERPFVTAVYTGRRP